MKETIEHLHDLIQKAEVGFGALSTVELETKNDPARWSKKEILGHLIDSAINNLQRFTEIQFKPRPLPIRRYAQRELVVANDYQNADRLEIFGLWQALNRRIEKLMAAQTADSLKYEVLLDDSQIETLEFLMKDYVRHLDHHLEQIFGEKNEHETKMDSKMRS